MSTLESKIKQEVIIAVVTPLINQCVNDRLIAKYIGWLKLHGVKTVVLFGSTGEGIAITDPNIIKSAYDTIIKQNVDCILSIQNPSSLWINQLIAHVQPEKIMVPPPFTTKSRTSDIVNFYKNIKCSKIMVYNNPARFGVDVIDFHQELFASNKSIYAIKHCAPVNCESWNKLHYYAQNNNFQVFAGDDASWPALADKVQGIVSVLGGCIPEFVNKLATKLLNQSTGEENIKTSLIKNHLIKEPLLEKLNGFEPTVSFWNHLCTLLKIAPNPLPIRYALSKLGFCTMETLLDFSPLTLEEENQLESYFCMEN